MSEITPPAEEVHKWLKRVKTFARHGNGVYEKPDLVVCQSDRVLIKVGNDLYYREYDRPSDVRGCHDGRYSVGAIHVAEMLCLACLISSEERHAFRLWWREGERAENEEREIRKLNELADKLGYYVEKEP